MGCKESKVDSRCVVEAVPAVHGPSFHHLARLRPVSAGRAKLLRIHLDLGNARRLVRVEGPSAGLDREDPAGALHLLADLVEVDLES
jgi:hypothetical protein